ncbi:MAG: serine hydrolase domain-containing protein [Sphingobium sp.]
MKRDGRMVKRIGAFIAIILLIAAAAGIMVVRADDAADGADAPTYVSAGAGVDETALRAAIDALFDDAMVGQTRALLVLRDGRPAIERYGPGFGPDSRLMSWSIARSVTAVLAGMMVADGRLALDTPAPVPAWSQPGDPRGRITVRQLLQMTSGIDHAETAVPRAARDSMRMLFTDGASDMAAFAESKPLASPPGSVFAYSPSATMILSDMMTRQLTDSDDPAARRRAMQGFIDGRLKIPARLSSLTPEYDAAGTVIGGDFLHMTARDHARFGEILRLRGRTEAGHRIVPAQWIDFMRAPSPRNPAYGAHLWLNHASGSNALIPAPAPEQLFGGVGRNGQYLLISPGQRLTIVRLGMSPEPEQRDALKAGLARLIALFPG